MKKQLLLSLSVLACYATQTCVPPAQMVLSHNFGTGVGHKGYSSADLFFIGTKENIAFYPFADLRFHVMDDGRFAFNGGLGFRQQVLQENLSVGANLYYDFRKSDKLDTSQISGQIEFLSKYIDFRLGGYGVISDRKHAGPRRFVNFSGNRVNIRQSTHCAFPLVNAEIGVPLLPDSYQYVKALYLSGGPYCLFGKDVGGAHYPNAWGGTVKLECSVTDYVDLRVEVNHDKIFHTTCQGVIALNIPLYKKTACAGSCSNSNWGDYFKRVLSPPAHNEIIPVKKKTDRSFLTDANGNVIQAFFVNNLAACPGVGTFEDPFCTFAQAEAAPAGPVLIYVFEGNSPTSHYLAPATGFTMKPGQILQGSGTNLVINGVTIPAQTSGRPFVEQTFAAPVIIATDSNTVQGFDILAITTQPGILVQAPNGGVLISDNTIYNPPLSLGTGIALPPTTGGSVSIAGNRIFGGNNGIGSSGATPLSLQISGNTISGFTSSGIFIGSANVTGSITQNTISAAAGQHGIFTNTGSQSVISITSNDVSGTFSLGGIFATNGRQLIQNNTVLNTGVSQNGIAVQGTSSMVAYVYNNIVTVTDPTSRAISFETFPGTLYVEVVQNQITTANLGGGIFGATSAVADNICASITQNTLNSVVNLNGSLGGQINMQQTLLELNNLNATTGPATIVPVVNFGSSCTAP